MTKKILSILAIISLIIIFGLVINEGLKRQERVECEQWQRDSKIYEGWYYAEWQREQCLRYGIEME